jgi:hypothetical protein
MIHALDDFLRDPERISVTSPSIGAEYLLNRVYMIHVQAIAELVNTCSDLSFVDKNVMVRRHVKDEPCQTGRVPYA